MAEPGRRRVVLRDTVDGRDRRWLEAYVDDDGRLHIEGQDLGPGTGPVGDDGEYEWFETIAATDVPRVVALLDGEPGEHVLDVLERSYTGTGSYELEKRLRECDIPIDRWTWRS